MKKGLILLFVLLGKANAQAQSIDSIRFHLYTDSLKRGSYNYINVEGRFARGQWLPLDTSMIDLKSSHGTLFGNSIWIPWESRERKVGVHCRLRSDTSRMIDTVIYIKTTDDTTLLKTKEEVLGEQPTKKRRRRRG